MTKAELIALFKENSEQMADLIAQQRELTAEQDRIADQYMDQFYRVGDLVKVTSYVFDDYELIGKEAYITARKLIMRPGETGLDIDIAYTLREPRKDGTMSMAKPPHYIYNADFLELVRSVDIALTYHRRHAINALLNLSPDEEEGINNG